ncbi:MAG: LysR family transcriptional regulator [Oligoflexales bacterium]|nr:LysR family transcriptional regulator [Oligoflexales bacterium]
MARIERMHLEIVRAIQTHGSVTAAAESLFVTQSALSHSIRKLEESFNLKIWYREGKLIRFTQGGEYLLSFANRVLPQLERVEAQLHQFALGERGTLRIGMECHPCYQWLLKVAGPFLNAWPNVDLDVNQRFQFGGIEALFSHDIDLLVTPDPLEKTKGLIFEPVFEYEQVLVVNTDHPLNVEDFVVPEQLAKEVLITYPVSVERLDVFSLFLTPSGVLPKQHKLIEATEVMLQMIACGRGVGALPRWLVLEQQSQFPLVPIKLGKNGINKKLYLGVRKRDTDIDYIRAFIKMSRKQIC